MRSMRFGWKVSQPTFYQPSSACGWKWKCVWNAQVAACSTCSDSSQKPQVTKSFSHQMKNCFWKRCNRSAFKIKLKSMTLKAESCQFVHIGKIATQQRWNFARSSAGNTVVDSFSLRRQSPRTSTENALIEKTHLCNYEYSMLMQEHEKSLWVCLQILVLRIITMIERRINAMFSPSLCPKTFMYL